MFANTLRLCTNRIKRQIIDDITRQISKTTSVTNSDAIVNITSRQNEQTEENQTKKLLKLRKYHR